MISHQPYTWLGARKGCLRASALTIPTRSSRCIFVQKLKPGSKKGTGSNLEKNPCKATALIDISSSSDAQHNDSSNTGTTVAYQNDQEDTTNTLTTSKALYEALDHLIPDAPDAIRKQASAGYLGLAVTHVAVVGALAAAGLRAHRLLLQPAAQGPLAYTLLGCCGAAALRLASLLLQLKLSVDRGELATWRHQRINAALAAVGLLTAVSVLPAVGSMQPLLAGVFVLLPAATAACCGLVGAASWRHGRPWFQWLVEWQDVVGTMGRVMEVLRRDVTSLAGLTCLGLLLASVSGFTSLALSPSSWTSGGWARASALVPTAPVQPAAEAVVAALRRVVGIGMLATAAAAHTLLDHANHIRWRRTEDVPAAAVVCVLRARLSQPRLAEVLEPSAGRFTVLNGAMAVAAVAQAVLLLRAPEVGIEVNADGVLWGPLFRTTALALGYALITLLSLDWISVGQVVGHAWGAVSSGMAFVAHTFYYNPDWVRDE